MIYYLYCFCKEGISVTKFKTQFTLIALSDHYILIREWVVIVDLVQNNYHDRSMTLKSVSCDCDRAVDYEVSSFCLNVF